LKRYRTAIVVVVLFAALLIIVLVTQPSNTQAPAVASTPTVSADQLKLQIIKFPTGTSPARLELTQSDPAKTAVYKLDGNWKLEGQESLPLDLSLVPSTVGQLADFSGGQLVEEKATNLAGYGLDKPGLTITVSGGNFSKTLLVGITNTVTSNYYVKLADADKVWAASPTLITTLKGWITAPPLAPPTPTPLPTLPPSPTPAPTSAVSGTPAPTNPVEATTAPSTPTTAATSAPPTTAPPAPTATP